jgi:transcriptional regulator with XRE-family HTH domain
MTLDQTSPLVETERTSEAPIRVVPAANETHHHRLTEISQQQAVWPRGDYDEAALVRYRECPDQLPPVRVDRQTGVLLDGYHRMKVHQELGRPEIPVIFEDCPPHKHLARSLELNLHGTPIPTLQRNRVLVHLSEQGFTQTEIAKVAGLTQERVSQILAASRRDSLEPCPEHANRVWDALRLVDQGGSLRDAARATGVPKSTVERALREAKMRQECIRRHLQTRKGLTSLLRYPDRGPWGQSRYFGNCTGYLLVDILDYLQPQSVFDPMEGSGTTKAVCFDLNVACEGRDLRSGFDLLSSPLPNRPFDLIFWHPPYWPGHQYTDHPNDFSNAKTETDFLHRMKDGFERLAGLMTPKGHLVILIGDGRKNGVFYPMHSKLIQFGLLPLEAVLIKEGDHERRARHFQYGPTPFIPTLHEYVLIFQGATP